MEETGLSSLAVSDNEISSLEVPRALQKAFPVVLP